MKQYADREYLHTRIHAMRGRLFRLRDYAAFLRDRETARNDDGTIDEQGLVEAKERLFSEQAGGVMLLAEASDYHRPLFFAFLRYFEIQNCRTLVAKVFGRATLEQWYPLGGYALLDRSLLEESPSLKLLEDLFTGTYLEEVFAVGNHYDRLQLQLDRLALLQVLRAANDLDRCDRELFREMITMRAALVATVRRKRLAFYYRWDEEKIEKDLAVFNDILDDDLTRHSVVLEQLFNREREHLKKQTGKEPALSDVEYRLELFYHHWVSRFFYRDFHSICAVAAYLWLLSRQVHNLFGVVDGLRFGLSHEAILGRVVSDS